MSLCVLEAAYGTLNLTFPTN